MSHRLTCAAVAVFAFLAPGCASNEPTIGDTPATTAASEADAGQSPTKDAAPSTVADPPPQTLGPDACVDLTAANLDLAVADNAEEAQKPADVFGRYDPPASVQEAIDHFVETGGVQYGDPDYDEFNSRIDEWVKAVCPL